jgi:hypothetical protein
VSRKATFFMQKGKDGLLHFCGDVQKRLYEQLVAGLPDGAVMEVTIAKRRHPKTQAQLGYYYGVLMPFACEALREAGYNSLATLEVDLEVNRDTTDMMFKRLFQVANNLERLPMKRRFTDEEMGRLIDFVADWLARNLQVTAPEPTKE